jgi:ATP-dependent Lhr-like helicase
VLLRRWGVVFRRVLEREALAPRWRDLLDVYRRLEARGEVRGGRFVTGFSGEQFALPEAVARLRAVRRERKAGGTFSVSAADPVNVIGAVIPGARVPAITPNRLLFRDGELVSTLVAGEVRHHVELGTAESWEAAGALQRRRIPPQLAAYLGRSA